MAGDAVMDVQKCQALLLDHGENPRHWGLLRGARVERLSDASTGDKVALSFASESGKIVAAGLEAEGSVVLKASCSLLACGVLGRNADGCRMLSQGVLGLLRGQDASNEVQKIRKAQDASESLKAQDVGALGAGARAREAASGLLGAQDVGTLGAQDVGTLGDGARAHDVGVLGAGAREAASGLLGAGADDVGALGAGARAREAASGLLGAQDVGTLGAQDVGTLGDGARAHDVGVLGDGAGARDVGALGAQDVDALGARALGDGARAREAASGLLGAQDGGLEANLGEALALKAIARLPARVRCASLPWRLLQQMLKQGLIFGRGA